MKDRPLSDDLIDGDDAAAARIRRAEAAIAALKANFAVWVKADIDLIDVHLSAAKTSVDPKAQVVELEALRRIAHNIKGQGGTFGCDGLSLAASELDTLLKRPSDPPPVLQALELVARLKAVFLQELA